MNTPQFFIYRSGVLLKHLAQHTERSRRVDDVPVCQGPGQPSPRVPPDFMFTFIHFVGTKPRFLAYLHRGRPTNLRVDFMRNAPNPSSDHNRDSWLENLRCPNCRKTGTAWLSAADEYSWDIQVIRVPEGFKVISVGDVSNFYCTSCDRPAEL